MPRTQDPTAVVVGGDGAVLVERHGHVLLVTLNRPRARNAVDAALTVGLGEALEHAEADADVRAVIVTGAGDRAFCAGADLKEVAAGRAGPGDDRVARWGFAGYVEHAISKPTIAAVNGFALGGGTEIVLASDLAVAADTASFGLPEVTRGLVAGAGGAFRLPRQIPQKVAMEAILTGRPLAAARALELGLVNRVVPLDDLLDAAFELADAICANAPLAVRAGKRIALGIEDAHLTREDADWRRTAAEAAAVLRSEDAREGMRAFAEQRAAEWRGR